ncbi:hypothetical protein LJ739_18755 [Aestuariibacter halophilus]|uniref:DUF6671 domain-containing protein n=1 Tax=Fluctibacter halophilus TaxID=226011 RepID=A0ABS8GD37_9ALTE|nr:DUF6671 family protein [Aestuariibacter halophilus]MCC2618304.1 hypothetical protein [Aestuariibacter halophilus]
MSSNTSCQDVVILTKHGKEQVLADVLEAELGWQLRATDAFDTDTLGTFSGDVERQGSAEQTATQKALLACELEGVEIGLGSEGSFGAGPFGQLIPWQVELVACHNAREGWTVIGEAQGPSCHLHRECPRLEDALHFWTQAPQGQGLMVYAPSQKAQTLRKGIVDKPALIEAYLAAAEVETPVMVEYDLRAHLCPARRSVIADAARDLLEKLNNHCPACKAPGFAYKTPLPGLECEQCTCPTQQPKAHLAQCQRCGYEAQQSVPMAGASPASCQICNP